MTKSDKTDSKKDSTRTSTRTKKSKIRAEDLVGKQKDAGIKQARELLGDMADTKSEQMLGLESLEDVSKDLAEGSRKVLETVLTDIFPEADERGGDHAIISGIRKACVRAQAGERNRGDEMTFWRHVADPGFMKVVKETGAALVGMHVLPLIATVINMAIVDKDKWALKTALQIAGIIPNKYDIYQLRWEQRHTEIVAGGDVNLGGKTDAELKDILKQINDVSDQAEVINSA